MSQMKNTLLLLEEVTEERDYWKDKAMTLLMQVRRLTSRMTDEEVKEFARELEDEQKNK